MRRSLPFSEIAAAWSEPAPTPKTIARRVTVIVAGGHAHFRDTNGLLAYVPLHTSLLGELAVLYWTGSHSGYTAHRLARFPELRKAVMEALDAAVTVDPAACPWDVRSREALRRDFLAGAPLR